MSQNNELKSLFNQSAEAPVDQRTARTNRGTYNTRSGKSQLVIGISPDDLSQPGGALISMLIQQANKNGHTLQEMAAALGITYPYIAQLRKGERKIENISPEFASSCAMYLGVPKLLVLMLSGKIKLEDFYVGDEFFANDLEAAFDKVKTDTSIGGYMPGELHAVSLPSKLFIVKLFELATKRTLLTGQVSASFDEMTNIVTTLENARTKIKETGLDHNKVHSLNR